MADPKEIAKKKYNSLFSNVLKALEETGKESYNAGKEEGIEETKNEYAGKITELQHDFDKNLRDKEQEYNSTMDAYKTEIANMRKEVNEAATALTHFMAEFADIEKDLEELEELPEISKKDVKKTTKKAKKLMKKL